MDKAEGQRDRDHYFASFVALSSRAWSGIQSFKKST